MSTNNFKFENILIVCPDFRFKHDCSYNECDEDCTRDGEYVEEFDDFGYEEYLSDVKDKLNAIGFEDCDKSDGDRNYSGRIISKWGLEDPQDGMIKWLEVVVRAGYYDGCNIDYTIDGDFGVNESNKKSVAHYEAMNRKFDKQVEKLKKVLRSCGQEMLKVAQFSNGEAVYQVKK